MARSIAMTQAGTSFYSRQTYFPYGAPRMTEGSALPTDNTFTGQKSDDSTGLLFYNARYYDTTLGRFTQPDTIVPNPLNPQSLNRFAYVLNNPLKYTDPTRHVECWDEDCNGGPSGGGGGNGGGGGGDSGNVNPCNADPTAEGCPGAQEAVPPASTGTQQNTNAECWPHCHDDVAESLTQTQIFQAVGPVKGVCLPCRLRGERHLDTDVTDEYGGAGGGGGAAVAGGAAAAEGIRQMLSGLANKYEVLALGTKQATQWVSEQGIGRITTLVNDPRFTQLGPERFFNEVNAPLLDDYGNQAGKVIVYLNNPDNIKWSSMFLKEVQHIQEMGYSNVVPISDAFEQFMPIILR